MKKFYLVLVLLLLTNGAQAALETAPSTIATSNQVDLFTFNVDASGLVNIYTESTAPANLALTLWSTSVAAPTSADWSFVASNDNTATWNVFETTNNKDAQIKPTLSAGQYLVSVYGSGVLPTGTLLSEGFSGNGATGYFPYILNVDGATVTPASLILQSSVSAVPLPATVWMFGSGLMTFLGLAKRKANKQALI